MNDQELEALCSLTLSQDESNHELFHMYSLEDKLKALDYFWEHVADKLPMEIISNKLKTVYIFFYTWLPFKSKLSNDIIITSMTFTLFYKEYQRYGTITLEFVVNKIREYVTNYHNSINQKYDN
jgi:hypothetical protein